MVDVIDRKIRQMHQALSDLENPDLTQVKVEHVRTRCGYYHHVDVGKARSEAQLANAASLLIANIASMKDHLKAWCKRHGKAFEGDKLIDSNPDVAVVHDLWNIDKHAELSRPPRSGHLLKLENLRQALKLAPGAALIFDSIRGTMTPRAGDSGKITVSIDAKVVDENGNVIGDLADICARATNAWKKALVDAGVPVPPGL